MFYWQSVNIQLYLGSAVSTFCTSENASRGKHYRNINYEQDKILPKENRVVSISPRKKNHDTQGEMSTQEVAYKSDKKHLKRGLKVENKSYPYQLPGKRTNII